LRQPPPRGAPGNARERNAGNPANSGRRRAGFTLVEVIVVLVILAILAAIAIPALTGYIDKAKDKKYIAEARNVSVAMKTLLAEDYAAGKIVGDALNEFEVGHDFGQDLMKFYTNNIAIKLYGNSMAYMEKAKLLTGETYYDSANDKIPSYCPLAPKDSGATAATADGFYYELSTEATMEGDPVVYVTYKLRDLDDSSYEAFAMSLDYDAVYDPDAGYKVYHLVHD
jgi:prepilin-type N-terminal cleavage/methylation domain-containing protein